MIADLGDAIRPYLKSFYNAVRDMPEAESAGLVSDMDSYDEVRSVDIANFDKPGINVATVEVEAPDVAFELNVVCGFRHGKTNFATKLPLQ